MTLDSLRRIDRGTFQYYRKMRYSISSVTAAARVSSAPPTMTAIDPTDRGRLRA
jgi:hypothetical protein